MRIDDIRSVQSEAGIIATLLRHPEFSFYLENLRPNHFTDEQNAYLYYAICKLARSNIEKIDAYNIINVLNAKEATKRIAETMTVASINELIDVSQSIARETIEEYQMLVDNVLDKAFRREMYKKLGECQQLCFSEDEKEIEQRIYSVLDDTMMDYSNSNELPKYADVVDTYWEEIQQRQNAGYAGIPFKFPALNEYALIEKGELFIFAAEAKQGKSMMLLNCAVDLLRKGYSVLYLDSELNSRMFTCRLIAHLAGIEFNRVRAGKYTAEERSRIEQSLEWIKTRRFTHRYMPIFDEHSVFSAAKKLKHSQGLDVIIIDYFKSKGDGDAFASYQELGRFVDIDHVHVKPIELLETPQSRINYNVWMKQAVA